MYCWMVSMLTSSYVTDWVSYSYLDQLGVCKWQVVLADIAFPDQEKKDLLVSISAEDGSFDGTSIGNNLIRVDALADLLAQSHPS